jgi:hypothetical protein
MLNVGTSRPSHLTKYNGKPNQVDGAHSTPLIEDDNKIRSHKTSGSIRRIQLFTYKMLVGLFRCIVCSFVRSLLYFSQWDRRRLTSIFFFLCFVGAPTNCLAICLSSRMKVLSHVLLLGRASRILTSASVKLKP